MWGGERNGCVYGEECRLFSVIFFLRRWEGRSVVGGMMDRYRCDLTLRPKQWPFFWELTFIAFPTFYFTSVERQVGLILSFALHDALVYSIKMGHPVYHT